MQRRGVSFADGSHPPPQSISAAVASRGNGIFLIVMMVPLCVVAFSLVMLQNHAELVAEMDLLRATLAERHTMLASGSSELFNLRKTVEEWSRILRKCDCSCGPRSAVASYYTHHEPPDESE